MASILCRPVDLLIVLCFISFALIAWTIDFTQSLYGSVLAIEDIDEWIWPPVPVLKAYAWWCETYDPLVAHNPMWYETQAWFSPFLYTPFYIAAVYAFVCEKEWIRVPALMWSYGLLLSMFVIVREQLFGKYAAPDRMMFFAAYGAYIVVPIIVLLRVAWTPVFSGRKLKPPPRAPGKCIRPTQSVCGLIEQPHQPIASYIMHVSLSPDQQPVLFCRTIPLLLTYCALKMMSILKRPLDLLLVLCLVNFLFIACTIDFTQSLYGSILELKKEDMERFLWPPSIVLQGYAWWCETYDPLVAKNPMWMETMAWFSPFLYAPFYVAAIYAFICEKEWIRVPALMWAYGLILTMFVIVREELAGKYAAPDKMMFAAAYGAYLLVPVMVILRVAWTPVFSSSKNKRE